jgi:GT2 family glycosyltransferase
VPAAAAISLVIATRNRAADLEATLTRLRAAPDPVPVVVVDNASSDATRDVVRAAATDGPVTLVALSENQGAAARTVGVRTAGTPIVAFNDDDSWWEPAALQEAVRLFEAFPRLGLAAGRVVIRDGTDDPVCTAMARSPMVVDEPLPGPAVLGFVACGAVVRRDAYLDVGGFHPRYGVGGEEGLLALDLWAAGHAVAYVPSLVAHHHASARRNGARRRTSDVRNDLWTLWLRRSAAAVTVGTARTLAASLLRAELRAGVTAALAGLPWVIGERRAVPAWLEAHAVAVARGEGA